LPEILDFVTPNKKKPLPDFGSRFLSCLFDVCQIRIWNLIELLQVIGETNGPLVNRPYLLLRCLIINYALVHDFSHQYFFVVEEIGIFCN
jgi:hypothetical protein